MNLETKITIYKFTPQVFTLTPHNGSAQNFIPLCLRKITLVTTLVKNSKKVKRFCFYALGN
jgi:hypothetical protein